MKTIFTLSSVVASSLIVMACSTTGDIKSSAPETPEWVQSAGGFTAIGCVTASNSTSADQQEALSSAQVQLAGQMKVKVQAINKKYIEKHGAQASEDFTSTSTTIVDEFVRGAVIKRQDYITRRGREEFCMLVAIPESDRPAVFEKVVQSAANAGIQVTELEKKNLYAAFME